MSDDQLKGWVAGFGTREQLIEECDVILQPKPLFSDIAAMRLGQVLWGWPHCVQDEVLTQVAIERGLRASVACGGDRLRSVRPRRGDRAQRARRA